MDKPGQKSISKRSEQLSKLIVAFHRLMWDGGWYHQNQICRYVELMWKDDGMGPPPVKDEILDAARTRCKRYSAKLGRLYINKELGRAVMV